MDDDFKKQLLGVTTEVGGGIATDFATSGLLLGGPAGVAAYVVANFGQGAYTNYLVQKHLYGNENINWGEVLGSGVVGSIPFMNFGASSKAAKFIGKANSFKRAAVGGAGFGVIGEQVRVGIDEKRVLNPGEVALAGGLGGVVGSAFKAPQALKNRRLAKRLRRPAFIGPDGKLDLKAIEAARAKLQPETLALSAELKKKFDADPSKPRWDGSMPKATGAAERMEAAIKRLRAAGYIRRDGSFRTVPKVTPSKTTRLVKSFQVNPESDIRTWRQGANRLVQRMDAKLTAREKALIGVYDIHHRRPLSQHAWLFYGLPPDEAAKAHAYAVKRMKQGGNVIENQILAFDNIHEYAHKIIDAGAGPMRGRAGRSIERLLDPGTAPEDFILMKTFQERKTAFSRFFDVTDAADKKIQEVLDGVEIARQKAANVTNQEVADIFNRIYDIEQIKILDDFSDYLNKQLDKTDINALQKLNELLDNYQERYLKIGAIVDGLRNKLGKDVKNNARYQKLVAEMRENTRLSDKIEDRKADLLEALGEKYPNVIFRPNVFVDLEGQRLRGIQPRTLSQPDYDSAYSKGLD